MIPVLAYHKIDEPTDDVKIRGAYTSPKNFRKQMLYLKKRGFGFYTAAELIDFYRENGEFPKKSVCVTLDDGWKDNFKNAFPVFQELQIKATIFLVPSCIGQKSGRVVADGEAAREHLSLDEIREMSAFGIEFGSHTQNHKLLPQISPEEVEFEVEESKKQIENLLQKHCRTFAYPAGFFTDRARAAVEKAGYSAAFTTVYGDDKRIDLYALNRTEILRRNRFIFQFAGKIKVLSE